MIQRMMGFFSTPKEVIRELIGRVRRVFVVTINRRPYRATRDQTRTDYEFFDKAQAGLIEGLEIAGLFLKPIANKVASWVLGKGIAWKIAGENAEALNTWFAAHNADLQRAYRHAVNLGDFFLVVNSDLSLTLVQPDVVEMIVDENHYGRLIGWRITERYDHPTEPTKWMIEVNEYYADKRLRWVEFSSKAPNRFPLWSAGAVTSSDVEVYRNLIGMIPVIHIPNNPGANTQWGTPEAAALVANGNSLLYRYDEILQAGLDGNIKQGRPTPTLKFKDAESMQAFYDLFAEDVQVGTDENGNPIYDKQVVFDSDKLMMVVGDFSYAQPGEFAGETEKMLALLYWLLLEHTEIPEFVMGTAIASSKASAETQLPVFTRWIEGKRTEVEGWMIQLANVVGAMLALTGEMPRMIEAPTPLWEALTDEDGKLTLEIVQWAYTEGLLSDEDALMMLPKEIENIPDVLKRAYSQAEKRNQESADQAKFEATRLKAIADGQGQGEDEENIAA